MYVDERRTRHLLETREIAHESLALRLKGLSVARLPAALANAALPLSAALDRWRAAVAALAQQGNASYRAEVYI